MSTTDKVKELNEARSAVAILEKAIAAELNNELAALPAQFGFASAADFVAAVTKATGKRRGRKPGKAKADVAPATEAESAASTKVKRRKKRAVITDATRNEVKRLVAAGKSGSEIAKAVGVSLPSVQNIKKALGLVNKAGKAKAEVAPAAPVAVQPATAKPAVPAKKKPRKGAGVAKKIRAKVKKKG